jgi:RecG-like helicase
VGLCVASWHLYTVGVALVQFGGVVLSTIASTPPGRSRVATQLVIDSEAAREQVRTCCICSRSAVWGLRLVHFGGLVLSTIASMPPGRSRVATQVVVDSRGSTGGGKA